MKKPIIIVLFCLVCGLFSCTQTDSGRIKSVGKTMATSIDSSYYLQDTIYNPYKKAGDTLEKKDCDTSIWQKDTNNDSTTTATTKQTVNPRRVVDEIHDSCGLFCDSENLKKFTEKINVDNVIPVVNMYKNTYGKSIFKVLLMR